MKPSDPQGKNHQELIKLRADIRARDKIIAEQAVRISELETAVAGYKILVEERGRAITDFRHAIKYQDDRQFELSKRICRSEERITTLEQDK